MLFFVYTNFLFSLPYVIIQLVRRKL